MYTQGLDKGFSEARSLRGILGAMFARQRYQLCGAIVVALVAPFMARYTLLGPVQFWDQAHTSVYVLIGIILSHFLIQDLSRYPGEDPLSSVIPSVMIAFICVMALITMGQLAYSRLILASGFAGTLAWYGVALFIRARAVKPRLMMAQTGDVHGMPSDVTANWLKVITPSDPMLLARSEGLVIDLSSSMPREWQDFAVSCATSGLPVYDLTKTRELITGEVEIDKLSDIGLDALLPGRFYLVLKSFLDFMGALLLLPLTLIIISIAAIAIKLESKGPIFFIQRRMGYRGREFSCFKLRSMRTDAEASGPHYTLEADPRITRVGRFIRKFRIDELPQIFNILRGEMSWIGPRPEAATLARYYEDHIPFYAFRHSVKPGITGWAAIRQGNVSELDAARTKLKNDFFYIKNLSMGLDAFISVKTIWIILTGFGARNGG